ncbi:MAG: ankyrin repeat domain-containing protein [Gammaproteobacteria bacterium]|nr:ankyrin repeat domain-containing protein [Gammaproteobacteria bacterium]
MSNFNQEQTYILRNLISQGFEGTSCRMNTEIRDGIKNAIEHNADPAILSENGMENTALVWAIVCGERDLASFLIDHPNSQDSLNMTGDSMAYNTPLMLAFKKGFYELAFQLIKKGVDLNAKTDEENKLTLLHLAILTLGASMKVDVSDNVNEHNFFNQKNDADFTLQQEQNFICQLIEGGANLAAKDKFDKTPLDYLSQPLDEAEIYFCHSKTMSFNEYCNSLIKDGIFVENAEVAEIKAKLDNLHEEERKVVRSLIQSGINTPEKLDEVKDTLRKTLPQIAQNYLNYCKSSNCSRTAKEIIVDPTNSFTSLLEIKESGEFIATACPKGGDNNITLAVAGHLDLHRKSNEGHFLIELIKSRALYLSTPGHQVFCNKIDDMLPKGPQPGS